jgi:hypothetical protein
MRSKHQKKVVNDTLKNSIFIDYYSVLILGVAWILHNEFGFGKERINRMVQKFKDFIFSEDLTTIAEELTYWADKNGINY